MAYDIEKRILDLIIAFTGIIVFLPVMLIIAVAIRLDSPGPIIADMPKRVGQFGKPFFMFKFRSMVLNAHQKLRTDPEFAELFKEYQANSYKLLSDPRVTRIGKITRKTSLDEFLQLFNVVQGTMSIVGPRAYFADELDRQAEHYPKTRKLIKKALTAKPGITGPWQVGGRSNINFSKRISMDAEYAKRRSILYDLFIILKTPFIVIFGKGAY